MRYRATLLPVLAVLVTMIALASVFVYYPLTITVQLQAPGVIFETGSNAGKPDIGTGNSITVTLGDNQTSASVTIHPTYQYNYYKDVLRITNNDDNQMSVYLIFTSVSNTLPQGSVVKILVYKEGNKVKEEDITDPRQNNPISIGTLAAGSTWQIDFYVEIPEGTRITGASYTATARLVYTPSSNETPPVNPTSGR